MPTVNSIRAAGFTVQPAKSAITCTEIISKNPFFYFNNNFCRTLVQMEEGLLPGRAEDENFVLLFAGAYDGDDRVPFTLLTEEQAQSLKNLLAEHRDVKSKTEKLMADMNKKLSEAEASLMSALMFTDALQKPTLQVA